MAVETLPLLQKDQPAYVQPNIALAKTHIVVDAYTHHACNEDESARLLLDDYDLIYTLNQEFSRTMMKMTAEAISEQTDLLAKRALKMHCEMEIWSISCVMNKLLYESGIAFPVLAKTPNLAPFFRMVTRLPKAYIDNVHQLQLTLEALHPAELIDLCTHASARNFIINIVKNVSLDTTEMENTIFDWCHKDALLNGAHFIIERIVAKPERQDLHVVVAQWMLNIPGLCLRTQLCKLAALLINESPHLPEVYALVQGYTTPFPKGIMVTTSSWNERSGKTTYSEELDPYCHDFIQGRLLRDDRLRELAAAIYHYDDRTGSHFEHLGRNFPELQETLDKVKVLKITCTFSSM
jgi:hypothetical protein